MTIYALIFYVLALFIVATTAMAITRRNLVHAIIYLIFSFFGSAMLFYLLGAPFLAALEVIIYAGAIMVLFLFIVIMMKFDHRRQRLFAPGQWIPAAVFGLVYLGIGALLVNSQPGGCTVLKTARATPAAFGRYVFETHWLSIEIVSLLLLVALVGTLFLGRRTKKYAAPKSIEDQP